MSNTCSTNADCSSGSTCMDYVCEQDQTGLPAFAWIGIVAGIFVIVVLIGQLIVRWLRMRRNTKLKAQRIAGSQAQRIAGSQAQQIGLEDIYRASSTDNPNPALNGTLDQLRGLNQAQQIAALTGMVSDLTGMVYQLQAGSNEAERSSSTYLSTDNPPPYSAEMYSSSDRSQAQQIAGPNGMVYQLQDRLNEAERSSSPSDQTNPGPRRVGTRRSSLYYLHEVERSSSPSDQTNPGPRRVGPRRSPLYGTAHLI